MTSWLKKFFNFLDGHMKNKINTLRSYYSKELAKTTNQKSGCGTNESYETKWEYFNALMFLPDAIKTRKKHSMLVGVYTNLSCHATLPVVLK